MPASRIVLPVVVLVLLGVLMVGGGTSLRTEPPQPVPLKGPEITGTLLRYESMPSRFVIPRNVDVWLPPSYATDPGKRYPVLYMQDGQNVFDPTTSEYSKTDWGVDETMTRLVAAGEVREAIVVGIWSTDKRGEEYIPQRAVQAKSGFRGIGLSDLKPADFISDRYLEFLVTELKPFIDATYRTLPDRANTYVMGSSAGALISQYAMSLYPEVFGGAGCVSTHWPYEGGILIEDFAAHLPDPGTHRYWFDYGTETLDANYEPYQLRVDEILRNAGYVDGENWITRKFPGAAHTEKSWRLRVDQPLVFLIGR